MNNRHTGQLTALRFSRRNAKLLSSLVMRIRNEICPTARNPRWLKQTQLDHAIPFAALRNYGHRRNWLLLILVAAR